MGTLGTRLRALREEKNLTLEQVANRVGTTKVSIGRYEKDEREPKSEMLTLLADFFEVSVDYLLGRTSEAAPTREYNPKLTQKDKKDIAKTLNEFKEGSKGSLMLDGEIIDEETEALLWKSIENILEIAKLNNKAKFTPKKYRK